MSTKVNDERLEELQAFLGEHDLDLEHNIRYSESLGYYAFKDVDDDEGQTIAIKVYTLPNDIQDTLSMIRLIPVEEVSENTRDYPTTTINL